MRSTRSAGLVLVVHNLGTWGKAEGSTRSRLVVYNLCACSKAEGSDVGNESLCVAVRSLG